MYINCSKLYKKGYPRPHPFPNNKSRTCKYAWDHISIINNPWPFSDWLKWVKGGGREEEARKTKFSNFSYQYSTSEYSDVLKTTTKIDKSTQSKQTNQGETCKVIRVLSPCVRYFCTRFSYILLNHQRFNVSVTVNGAANPLNKDGTGFTDLHWGFAAETKKDKRFLQWIS